MGTKMYHFLHRALLKYTFRTHKHSRFAFLPSYDFFFYPLTALKTLTGTFLHLSTMLFTSESSAGSFTIFLGASGLHNVDKTHIRSTHQYD